MTSRPRVVAAVLAAGGSRRLGRPKQQVRLGAATLLDIAVEAALGSGCERVLVVLGAAREEIEPSLAGRPVEVVPNPGWEEGIASSIRAAVGRVRTLSPAPDGLLISACDQPKLTAEVLDSLRRVFDPPERTVAACLYAGHPGIPALFEKSHFDELLALREDRGARGVLERHRSHLGLVPWEDGAVDVDTPEDLERLDGGATRNPPL